MCSNNLYFNKIIAPFDYKKGSINAIKQLKLYGYKSYAKYISEYITDELKKDKEITSYDIIIPVPMYHKNKKNRTFNQSELISKFISKDIGVPLHKNIIKKKIKTKNQRELSEYQRKRNLINAFSCEKPELVKNKKIILCDDVYTTGSTLNIISHLLKSKGAQKIICAVFATTQI